MDDRTKTRGHVGWCDPMSYDVDKTRGLCTGVLGRHTDVMNVGKGPYTILEAGA